MKRVCRVQPVEGETLRVAAAAMTGVSIGSLGRAVPSGRSEQINAQRAEVSPGIRPCSGMAT